MKWFLKRALFWVLFIPMGVTMLGLEILAGISEDYDKLLLKYEKWTFDLDHLDLP
jgi:hypothetical protein